MQPWWTASTAKIKNHSSLELNQWFLAVCPSEKIFSSSSEKRGNSSIGGFVTYLVILTYFLYISYLFVITTYPAPWSNNSGSRIIARTLSYSYIVHQARSVPPSWKLDITTLSRVVFTAASSGCPIQSFVCVWYILAWQFSTTSPNLPIWNTLGYQYQYWPLNIPTGKSLDGS